MASAGRNTPFDELLGEGSNSENDQGNPEICYNDEITAQMEERRMHVFGYGDSDCEDENIPAPLYFMDDQGRSVQYEEFCEGEEIIDEIGENN